MLTHRHRRSTYSRSRGKRESGSPVLPKIIALLLLAGILYVSGKKIIQLFGIGNRQQSSAAVLILEDQGTVSVSIEDREFKRAEDQLKLYPGDRLTTGRNSYAQLSFFDGTRIRLDQSTELAIRETKKGSDESTITLHISKGGAWMATPTVLSYSGTVTRTVQTNDLLVDIPSRSEVMITDSSIAVFSADGLGTSILLKGLDDPIRIGEGQQLTVPRDVVVTSNPYQYRTPLDPTVLQTPFLEESRNVFYARQPEESEPSVPDELTPEPLIGQQLTLTSPEDGIQVDTSTIVVSGRITDNVKRLRVNGYHIDSNPDSLTFSEELALPDEEKVTILVEALAEDGTVLEELRRTVLRNREPPKPPTISQPAPGGSVYQTPRDRLEIIGEVSSDTVGVTINDYRLQLFKPGDTSWTYLASTTLENYKPGKNEFVVTAINKAGYVSEPTILTIWLREGEEGIIEEAPEETEEVSTDEEVPTEETEETPDEIEVEEEVSVEELPDNAPLLPGSLVVVAPTAGTTHSATETELLIEGTTDASTDSIWVNGYKLRLYEAGKTTWNYIADTKLGTLQRGSNTYSVTARNSENQILDTLE